MTEAQWLASTDPRAMLAWLEERSGRNWYRGASNRKLRLFACAVAYLNGHDTEGVAWVEKYVEAGHPNHDFNDQDAVDRGQFWRRSQSTEAARGAASAYAGAHTAGLLRCVAGNPFRPVVLPEGPRCRTCEGEAYLYNEWGGRTDCPDCEATGHQPCPWLTPQVLSLARAAYQERPGRECGECGGDGWISICSAHQQRKKGCRLCDAGHDCPTCHGTGRIEDGRLDPVRLCVLADALEEAGCVEVSLLAHLRGKFWCPWANREGYHNMVDPTDCPLCSGDVERPLRVPCVRGCWSLDLILGHE